MVACNDTAADSGRAVVHHAAATAAATAVFNLTATDGQRAACIVKNATAILTPAVVDDTTLKVARAFVADATTRRGSLTARDGAALEVKRAIFGNVDAAAIIGPAASQLTTVIATAVLHGQRAALPDPNHMTVRISCTQAAAQCMAVQVERDGSAASDTEVVAQRDVGTEGDDSPVLHHVAQTVLGGYRVLQAAGGVVAAQGAEALRLEGVGRGAACTVVTGEGVCAVAVVGIVALRAPGAVMVAGFNPHLLALAAEDRPLIIHRRAIRGPCL